MLFSPIKTNKQTKNRLKGVYREMYSVRRPERNLAAVTLLVNGLMDCHGTKTETLDFISISAIEHAASSLHGK